MEKEAIISLENFLPPSQDYAFLRREGIRLIERMAGDTWTDYNPHDPGITILEALCYALTDLGYRTAYPIRDLLVNNGHTNGNSAFFNQAQILPCDALTITDIRKLVIDTDGVKNAWVETSTQSEVGLYAVNDEHGYRLSYDLSDSITAISLKGLYKILIEYEDKILLRNAEESVAAVVRKKLDGHRGLCEDFLTISSVEYEWFPMEAEIQVNEGVDIERINAQVFDTVQSLFSPPVNFYTLEQMLVKGYSITEIFEGPLLRHGFIDANELEQSSRNNLVHLSTVVNSILRIPGVIAVKKCLFPVGSQSPFADFTEWMHEAARAERTLRLDVQRSSVIFSRTGDRHRSEKEKQPDRDRVNAIYSFLRSEKKSARLKNFAPMLPMVQGEDMQVEDYQPFQHTLPTAYGLQEKILPAGAAAPAAESLDSISDAKKKVLQLKGFLLVFEQLMSDYLLQLSNISDLLSINEPKLMPQVSRPLSDIEGLDLLIEDTDAYQTRLSALVETEKEALRRKNLVLDHLLSRFGEELDRYSAYMRNQGFGNETEIIAAKASFLQQYTKLSCYRGTAYNCADNTQIWNTENVPGIKKRICGLLGIADFRTRTLCSSSISVNVKTHANDLKRWVATVGSEAENADLLLETNEYASESEIRSILDHILQKGFDKKNYEISARAGKFKFQLMRRNQEDDLEPVSTMNAGSKEELDTRLEKLIDTLTRFSRNEGFHLIEHILLRPRVDMQDQEGSVALLSVTHDLPATPSEGEDQAVRPFRFKVDKGRDAGSAAKTISHLSLVNERRIAILAVPDDFIFSRAITERIESIRNLGADRSSYVESVNADGYHVYTIQEGERLLARSAKAHRNKEDMDKEIQELVDFFSYEVKWWRSQSGLDAAEYIDPYSLQVSFFFPDWPVRFRDPAFRHLIEKTVYLETPAHIFPHVHWLDYYQMDAFEKVYRPWLENIASNNIPDTALQNNLVQFMNGLISTAHED